MSDFVTRIAQRQLDHIKIAEPRLPDLYAPRSPSERSLGVSSRQSGVEEAFESLPLRSAGPTLVDGALSQPAVRREQIAQTTSQPAAPASTQADSETAQHGGSPHSELGPRSKTSFQTPEQRQQRDASTTQFMSLGANVVLPRPLVPTATSARLSAPARLVPARDGVARAQSPSEQPAVEAAVHVTIGRIEVTAQTQPAPVKRAPVGRKPSMSLDDYLARRQRRES